MNVRAGSSYDSFSEDMFDAEKNNECRYAVFDAEYVTATGMVKNKILFFMWSVLQRLVKNTLISSINIQFKESVWFES